MQRQSDFTIPHCHILMADDEPDFLHVLTHLLTKNGYSVEATTNGRHVKAMIENHKPDIILLDVRLGDSDGAEICRELKQSSTSADIPIVMISANDNLPEIATRNHADGYISKPLRLKQLLERIANLIGRKK
jgi:DNA-binding response OmpR family regulator